jgi:hypothetical protein
MVDKKHQKADGGTVPDCGKTRGWAKSSESNGCTARF